MLQPAVERAPAQPERPGGLAHVAVMAVERLPDQDALDLLERQVLQPGARPPPRRPRSAARTRVPAAISTARSSVWSSSRTLPGQAWTRAPAAPRARSRPAASGSGRRTLEEVLGQRADVVAPLAQRRQADLDRVEPKQQVLAEPSGRHLGGEVGVGGREDADVDLAGRARRRPARPRRSRARGGAWPAAAARGCRSRPAAACRPRPARTGRSGRCARR